MDEEVLNEAVSSEEKDVRLTILMPSWRRKGLKTAAVENDTNITHVLNKFTDFYIKFGDDCFFILKKHEEEENRKHEAYLTNVDTI